MSSSSVILLVEGARPASSLAPVLEGKGYVVALASNGKEALNQVREAGPALALVNAATLHTDGQRLCVELREACTSLPIVMVVRHGIDPNKLDCADVVLVRPFTSRKLLNRIGRLLPDSAGEVLGSDNLVLNLNTHLLRVGRVEHRLTPMKARLLEEFLRHPGETLSREYLMKQVWQTNYTGDTRTIEVHVRWLRQIIEVDAAQPKLLKTVRGVGYRSTIGVSD
ncbi:MAG: response regulator transcription factor [Chloroflexi bacterium]|nr:response regulator transcription factor [Chloroflexota bacterium]